MKPIDHFEFVAGSAIKDTGKLQALLDMREEQQNLLGKMPFNTSPAKLTEMHNSFLAQIAKLLTHEEYVKLFDFQPGQQISFFTQQQIDGE